MSLSSEPTAATPAPTTGHRVLRGAATEVVQPARLDMELRRAPSGAAGAGLGAAVGGSAGRQAERWIDHATAAASTEIREAARAEGYAQGYAEGRRAAEETRLAD